MKFEEKYPVAKTGDSFDGINKLGSIGACAGCGAMTRWFDQMWDCYFCSEECYRKDQSDDRLLMPHEHIVKYADQIRSELSLAGQARPATKDIIIVVHDQLHWVKQCVESVRKHTTDYTMYIWDNASGIDTSTYLDSLIPDGDVQVVRSNENIGFIAPNNDLVNWGNGEYVILLNSDCIVFNGWADSLIGFLQTHDDVAIVGASGGVLGEDGIGMRSGFGYDVDYVHGWCMAFSRDTYDRMGLFNKQLKFAYGEDSDFCLRAKEAGKKIYAFHSQLAYHAGNATAKQVRKERDMTQTFEENHQYIRLRWANYLKHERVHAKRIKDDQELQLVPG
jgi:GT2 family glycosyltransferase